MGKRAAMIIFAVLASALSACSTTKAVIPAVPDSPSIEQAKTDKQTDVLVRWGGEVVKLSNFSDYTLVEVLARSLDKASAPRLSDQSGGRFIARINQFLDPENLKAGRRITVRGTLSDWQSSQIGEYQYQYPLVMVDEFKIWPEQRYRPRPRHYDPYWPHPMWDHPYFYRPWPHSDYMSLHYNYWYH